MMQGTVGYLTHETKEDSAENFDASAQLEQPRFHPLTRSISSHFSNSKKTFFRNSPLSMKWPTLFFSPYELNITITFLIHLSQTTFSITDTHTNNRRSRFKLQYLIGQLGDLSQKGRSLNSQNDAPASLLEAVRPAALQTTDRSSNSEHVG